MDDLQTLGLPYMIVHARNQTCSACDGFVRRDTTYCKHCRAVFATAPDAYTIYQAALTTLKADPTNADLRQRALSVGRAYSFLTRQSNITVYDEMAVMNDIAAATAGAGAQAPNRETIESRLARLNDLHTKGLVSDQERNERRQKILDEL